MTDLEFDVLDELYFVQSFKEVSDAIDIPESELLPVLISLYDKGWIRVFVSPDEEVEDKVGIADNYVSYFYLASKQGLLAHNLT